MTDSKEYVTSSPLPSILMILEDLGDLGGGEKQAWRLAQALSSYQVSVEMVTACWTGQNRGRKVVEGIPVHYILSVGRSVTRRRGGRRLSRYAMIVALLYFLWRHRSKYEILHFHESDFLAATGVFAAKLLNKPVITKVRTSGKWNDVETVRKQWRGPEKGIIVSLLQRADRIISLNEESAQELLAAGFASDRIVHLVNGIDTDRFMPRSDYTLNAPPKLLFVGRLQPQKNVETLLQALALVSHSEAQLVLLGDGFQRDFLEKLAESLKIRQRITFCGRVAEVTPFLQEADLFVLPSLAEGISNALLEAMAAGLPCVATDVAGNRAIILPGENGLLVPPRDPVALAKAIEDLLADESLRHRLGQAGREKVMRDFSISRVAEAYASLYRELLPTFYTKAISVKEVK